MKKNRLIQIKDPLLRKIRFGLRQILLNESKKRLNLLHEKRRELQDSQELKRLRYDEYKHLVNPIVEEVNKIRKELSASIVVCAICRDIEGDRVFNPKDKIWYCPKCYAILEKSYQKELEALGKVN
ncbi:MAG: hypothetical protein ACFFBC_00550 [Promethearchaeota archaeon]